MTHNEIITYCLAKSGAYLDYPFGPDVTVVKVRKRVFSQVFNLKGEPTATFNCDLMTGEFYRSLYPGTVVRGYHCPPIQQPYFNTIRLDGIVADNEIKKMIDHSYDRVVKKLTRREQAELCAGMESIRHEA